jgi:CTP synthase
VNIGLVGKYVELKDSYKSLVEALTHGGLVNEARVQVRWLDAEDLKESDLAEMNGILVPGGFGGRGIEGKLNAIRYAREHQIPFLGICLGMQCAVIEYARNVVGLKMANSSEFEPHSRDPVIDLLPDQKEVQDKGGTMRLGAYPCRIQKDSRAYEAYQQLEIGERHRHRYEFNNAYREPLTKAGMVLSGLSPDSRLVEIIELVDHPWFVGTQFHPEFKSRLRSPHPLFREYIKAALKKKS